MKSYQALSEVQADLSSGIITCTDLVQQYLLRIEEKKHLNAFLEVFTQSAMQKAKEVDEKLKNGTAGILAGMVIGLKDNICYKNHYIWAFLSV